MARELTRASREAKDCLREAAVKMAKDAGRTPPLVFRAIPPFTGSGSQGEPWDVNRNGGAYHPLSVTTVKTPNYSGRSHWEAFHAQFELLVHADGWSIETKAGFVPHR